MNLTFLGDALDHWKGALFESLHRGGVFRNFAVDAMATDIFRWEAGDFDLFAKLLRIDRTQILEHQHSLSQRKAYFGEIQHTGDLFLDPDTGIATGKCGREHLAPEELATLLGRDRIVAVYQHVRAQSVSTRVDAVTQAVRVRAGDCHWCSYESGTVAMVFFDSSGDRVGAVRNHFDALLGRHAAGRIRGS